MLLPSPARGPEQLPQTLDSLGLLEPGAVKVARRVLRGPRRSNAPGLPDEVEGKKKQGAAYGYTKVLGYHPILASRADTGEIVHARMRKGSANTARGARRFIDEVVARLRRAGAAGEIVMRFDSGFWSKDTIATLARHGVRYTMAVRTNTKGVAEAIADIDETPWTEIDYTPGGQAQVAETEYGGRRLIVRRTRLTEARQARLWPDWRHFAFLTDLDGDAVDIDAFHRAHASIELAIRDLKEGAGLEHCPSGNFSANSAWLQCAVLAHNLIRWTATIAEPGPIERLTVARTVRFQLLAIPARLVNRSGTLTLQSPGPLAMGGTVHPPPRHHSSPARPRLNPRRHGAPPTLTGADNPATTSLPDHSRPHGRTPTITNPEKPPPTTTPAYDR